MGDIFLSSAMISYLGPLTAVYREELKNIFIEETQQAGLCFRENYSFISVMGDLL